MDNKHQNTLYAMGFAGLVLVVIALIVEVFAGLGTRWEWWHFGTGFQVLKWGVYIAIAGVVLSIGGFLYLISEDKKLLYYPLGAVVLSVFVIAVPANHLVKAKNAPMIHEITTDIGDPPLFTTIAPIRFGATNSAEYDYMDGDRIIQKKHYGDIRPVRFNFPKAKAVDIVFDVAEDMCWEIVYSNKIEGIIEATATTFWFGFKDDVSIRVTTYGVEKSTLDMRSLSRVGRGDAGRNADRIRYFLAKVEERVDDLK